MSDELAKLAGGTEEELAVDQIRRHVIASKRKLREQFPFFYNDQEVE